MPEDGYVVGTTHPSFLEDIPRVKKPRFLTGLDAIEEIEGEAPFNVVENDEGADDSSGDVNTASLE